jgi:hypothetical protein
VRYGERSVRSELLTFPGVESGCFISGRFDIVAELDDRSYGIFDFKTGRPNDEKSRMYGRQLHAYAVALERPAKGELALKPITSLGLLYFTPDRCAQPAPSRQLLEGQMQWQEVRRDDGAFMTLLEGVIRLLDGPMPPLEPERCDWCAFSRRTNGGTILHTAGKAALGGGGKAVDPPPVAGAPVCPTCNGPMRRRNGKFGEFWSCMNYPNCRGTRNVG